MRLLLVVTTGSSPFHYITARLSAGWLLLCTYQVKVSYHRKKRKTAEYVLVAHADPLEDFLVFKLNVAPSPSGRELSCGSRRPASSCRAEHKSTENARLRC